MYIIIDNWYEVKIIYYNQRGIIFASHANRQDAHGVTIISYSVLLYILPI